jgi:hypothetical protein
MSVHSTNYIGSGKKGGAQDSLQSVGGPSGINSSEIPENSYDEYLENGISNRKRNDMYARIRNSNNSGRATIDPRWVSIIQVLVDGTSPPPEVAPGDSGGFSGSYEYPIPPRCRSWSYQQTKLMG